MRAFVVVLVAASALLVLPPASAKEFGPGDLSVCDATRCAAIVNRDVLPLLGSFYYGGPRPKRVRGPALGAPYYELRFDNDYVTGIVATRRLDRFLSLDPPRCVLAVRSAGPPGRGGDGPLGPRPGRPGTGPERTGRVQAPQGPEPGREAAWRVQTDAPPAQIGGSRLSYGVYLERFERNRWYAVPLRLSRELRRLTQGMRPLRVTRPALAKSR